MKMSFQNASFLRSFLLVFAICLLTRPAFAGTAGNDQDQLNDLRDMISSYLSYVDQHPVRRLPVYLGLRGLLPPSADSGKGFGQTETWSLDDVKKAAGLANSSLDSGGPLGGLVRQVESHHDHSFDNPYANNAGSYLSTGPAISNLLDLWLASCNPKPLTSSNWFYIPQKPPQTDWPDPKWVPGYKIDQYRFVDGMSLSEIEGLNRSKDVILRQAVLFNPSWEGIIGDSIDDLILSKRLAEERAYTPLPVRDRLDDLFKKLVTAANHRFKTHLSPKLICEQSDNHMEALWAFTDDSGQVNISPNLVRLAFLRSVSQRNAIVVNAIDRCLGDGINPLDMTRTLTLTQQIRPNPGDPIAAASMAEYTAREFGNDIRATMQEFPVAVAFTLAHEIGHVHLAPPGKIRHGGTEEQADADALQILIEAKMTDGLAAFSDIIDECATPDRAKFFGTATVADLKKLQDRMATAKANLVNLQSTPLGKKTVPKQSFQYIAESRPKSRKR